ncbi:hypothetical protein [Amycolatopsis sp. RTGN1]|uniref:hypothetical protein n=1 Tax=Amycolatopsis ponsaeliensis TaxID=2992142 RepID=UPI00254C9910|nr:hypothetical protein [Amycolatopsis sp. RTGN1]
MPDTATDDLGPVLRDLAYGRLAQTRAKLANSPETREFLELGLQLLRDDLIGHTGPDFETGIRSKLFESVSRERILQRAEEADRDRPNPKVLTVNMFRYRWERKDRYTEDLISYLFRPAPQGRHFAEMAATTHRLIPRASFAELVRTLADAEVRTVLEDPLVSLQSTVQSAMPNHPRVREFCQAHLDHLMPRWADLYVRITDAYGLRLKAGFTWLDVALMFNAVVEGELTWSRVAARSVLSGGGTVVSTAILAILSSVLDDARDFADCYAVAK